MCAVALRSRPISLARLRGARKRPFPSFVEPCDPTLRDHAPVGEEWCFEIKADGYRAQLHLQKQEVTVYSRTGLDWTKQFSSIAHAAPELGASSAMLLVRQNYCSSLVFARGRKQKG